MAIPQTEAEVFARVADLSRKGIPLFTMVDPNAPLLVDKTVLKVLKEYKPSDPKFFKEE